MNDHIATAVCYFAFGFGVALALTTYWLHTEHVEWKRIVDHLHHIIERHLVYRELDDGGGMDADEFIRRLGQQECEADDE